MRKDDCIFCKIAAGEIPATKVYEDDDVLAFEDLSPMMPVADNSPDEVMGRLFNTVGKVARLKGVEEGGFRVVVNTGDDACQSVHHVHVHVLGGAQMNDGDPSLKGE